jgi:uncharacterized protein YraI
LARKKYKITPQGYITIGAAVILLIALIILLSVTNCFGACSGKEGAVDLPSLTATATPTAEPASTPLPSSTSGGLLPIITPNVSGAASASPDVSGTLGTGTATPASVTPSPSPTAEGLKEDPKALKKPTNAMVKEAGAGELSGNDVNLRQGPSTKTPIVIQNMKRGTELTLYTTDGDFYFVKVNSAKKYGYVAKKFVKVTKAIGAGDTKEDLSDQPEDTVLGTITASKLAIREKPSTDAKAIGEYYKDKKVYIYYKEGDFYYVKVAGTKTKGYMAAKFIKASGEVKSK